MAEFKLVINNPKTSRSYQLEIKSPDADNLIGKKIKGIVRGELIGLTGYEFEITGGTDKDGFPMRPDVKGPKRAKLLLSGGTGFKPISKGHRKRKTVRGNTISGDIVQINMKTIKYGEMKLDEFFKKEEKKE